MQILLYNWFVCSNFRISIKKESWSADLTVQLVPLLKPQDLDKRGELECRSYFTTGSSSQISGL